MNLRVNHPIVHRCAIALGMWCVVLFVGCDDKSGELAASDDAVKPVVQQVDRGPIKLTVTADRERISIAERLKLRVEVEAETGIDVTMPPFGSVQSEFQLRDQHEEPVKVLADDVRQYVQVYDLDSFLSGEYIIGGVTVQYVDRRNNSEGDDPPTAELTTEPITIEVTSLLEGEFDPADFRDVKGVVELPVDRSWRWLAWTAGGVGVLIFCGLLGVFLVRKYRRGDALVATIPPHEWAFAQLRALADSGLIETGEFRPFYYRLSEITRTYIELRFGLMAPERTTEEFLDEMRSSNALDETDQAQLQPFLVACDRVKYALYEPTTSEIEGVFDAARDFVERTRPQSNTAVTEVAA